MKYKNEQDWTDEVIERFWNNMVSSDELYFAEAVGLGIIKLIKSKINLTGKILDYGCGNGIFMNYLSKVNPNSEIHGVDFSSISIEKSINKNISNKNVKGIFNIVDIDNKLIKNSYDVIFLIETIEHLRNDTLKYTLKNIYELLKPGGYLIVTTPFNEDLKANSIYCPFCDAAHHHMQHLQSFTIERLSEVLSNNDFKPFIVENTDFSYYQNKISYYKLHLKWYIKLKLNISKRKPFQKLHLYGIAQKIK